MNTLVMQNVSRKVAGAFLVASVSMGLVLSVAPLAGAQTTTTSTVSTAQLQAQIQNLLQTIAQLQAQISSMSGGQTGTNVGAAIPANFAFTRTLRVGSTGQDVRYLQMILNQSPTTRVASSGAGSPGMESTYFGPLTRNAVIRYQQQYASAILTPVGLTAGTGVVGPSTRAHLNARLAAGPITPTTPDDDGDFGDGDEGQITNLEELSRFNDEEVVEGEEDVEVLGFEYEAQDSDIMVERIDVDFTHTGNGSDNLNDYIESVSVWHNGEMIDELDVDEADEDDDIFSFRFSGLEIVTNEDETDEITIAVTAQNNIDTEDMGEEWTVEIPEDGIRALDEADLSDEYADENEIESTFTLESISTAGNLELNISRSEDDLDERTVQVDEDSDTNDVELLIFEMEAEGSDITVDEIPVRLVVTGATDVDAVVNTLTLEWDDGEDSESISTSGASTTVNFTDLEIDIEEGETIEFRVFADINEIEAGTFDEGDSVRAELRSTEVEAIDAEDENGDEIEDDDLTGTAVGEDVSFFTSGIEVEFVSAEETKTFTADDTGESDIGQYRIRFEVTAFEDDIYLDRDVTEDDDPSTPGEGFTWATTSDTTADATVATEVVSATDVESNDTSEHFFIREGDTRTFTLTVSLDADSDGVAAIMLTGINWTTDENDTTPDNFYTVNLDEFKTDVLSLFVL